jgi:SAM-dependent methyltransferase
VAGLAPDLGSYVWLVLEVDHGRGRHGVHLAPNDRLALTVGVLLHEFDDLGVIRGLAPVAGRARCHGGEAGLVLGLNTLMTTGAGDIVLAVRLVVERDRLWRRWWGLIRAPGEYGGQDGDPEPCEPTQAPPSIHHAHFRSLMSLQLPAHLRSFYAGEAGETWARIERESPATYWEENAILGRRDTYDALLERLQPVTGRRVLDAGCGRGLLARRLAGEGALVTGVDLLSHRVLEARGGDAPTFAVADFRDVLSVAGTFDDVVIQEVLEDYSLEERKDTIFGLANSRVPRIHLIFRQQGRWGGLIAPMLPDSLVPTLDPVQLLRSIHLHTPYRLTQQESIRRRSYSVQMVQLTLEAD